MDRLISRPTAETTSTAIDTREALLERLSRIQRSISHGAPLEEVFGAIAAGAAELLGDPVAGLRVVDEDDPARMLLVANVGLTPEQVAEVRLGRVGEGAGGRAIIENAVVVLEDYPAATDGIARFGEFGVQNALAAPVRVEDVVVGSLTVASFEAGRRYGPVEQDVLSALAEHAGMALHDASVISRRERLVERKSEERFQALVEHSSDLIAIVDGDGVVAFATPSVSRALGLAPGALEGSTVLAHLHPADRPRAVTLLRAAAAGPGTMPAAEWRLVPADKPFDSRSWLHVEVVVTNLLDHPDVRGIVLNARDVTERVAAEQAQRDQDALYRQIVDTTHDGVWMTDRDERTIFVNDALARMLGSRPEEITGRRPTEFMDADQALVVAAAMERRRHGAHDRYEVTMRRADGSPLRLAISGTPLFEDDRFAGALALCSDITELVVAREEKAQLAAQLQHAQELEMLGRLAGQVAHDFNQVLAVILGYAGLLRAREPDARTTDDLERIVEAADHGAALARQLVMFSRRDGGDPEILDLADVTRATARLVMGAAPEGVAIVVDTGDEPLPVSIDPTKLRQVLMNLVDNAFDAMPDGGRLVLTTDEMVFTGRRAARADGLPPGHYVRLVVSDNGEGMSPDVMARAIEPAFTTKPAGQGTGLGLSIAHGAIRGAAGHLGLRETPGGGTTVEILLPRATDLPDPIAAEPEPAAAAVAGDPFETILLVEDDASVLDLTARVLTEAGYSVVTATNGEDALAAAQERSVDLLLTDQTMPGGSGLELARRLGELRPGVPAVVMSGFAAGVSGLQPAGIDWLQKPFGADALLGAVRGALSRA
jgi:PAS domain S-box-containing protein